MTARKILLATFGVLAFATAASEARPRPGGNLGGRSFDANKTFGLGLELGAPTGLVGKYFLSPDRALDFGIGDLYTYFNRSGLHIYGDYLFHPVSFVSAPAFELPLYVGVGARFWDFGYRDVNQDRSAFAFGVRVPVGVSFDFNNVPLDIFVQVVPVIDFFSGYAPHTVFFDVDGSVGVRYWFN